MDVAIDVDVEATIPMVDFGCGWRQLGSSCDEKHSTWMTRAGGKEGVEAGGRQKSWQDEGLGAGMEDVERVGLWKGLCLLSPPGPFESIGPAKSLGETRNFGINREM